MTVDPLMLAVVRLSTSREGLGLTRATGFLLRRDDREFLVSCRHVFFDAPSGHFPDQIEVELHADLHNLARAAVLPVPLYHEGVAVWRQGSDGAGEVDVAVIEIRKDLLRGAPARAAFDLHDLAPDAPAVPLGQPVLIVGFPMGFHDELHHLPVARSGIVSSSYGWRFGGLGYFLTDAKTHRGLSGAPVVMRDTTRPELPWRLLGIHSARLEGQHREFAVDETLGLNCSWYPDILHVLTSP